MLGALKHLFTRKPDGAATAPPPPVEAVAATFEEVTQPTDGGELLRRIHELPAETAAVLREIGMPEEIARTAYHAEPEYSFPLRPADKPRHAARRFLIWARAMDWKGEFRPDQVWEAYEDFCLYDHRHPVQMNYFLSALERCPGVEKKRKYDAATKWRDPRWTWTIKPRPFSKALGSALTKTPATEPASNVVALRRAA